MNNRMETRIQMAGNLWAYMAFAFALCVAPGSANWGFGKTTPAREIPHTYHALQTVSYSNGGGVSVFLPSAGTIVVRKRPAGERDMLYQYGFVTDVFAPRDMAVEISMPLVSVRRDTTKERFVGGDALLRNFGRIANHALEQAGPRISLDGRTQRMRFAFPRVEGFPAEVTYNLRGTHAFLATGMPVIGILAVSEPFSYDVPGSHGLRIEAQNRMLTLLTADMEDVLFQISRYSATVLSGGSSPAESLNIEQAAVRTLGANPMDLRVRGRWMEEWIAALGLSNHDLPATLDQSLPVWAQHSLAVRGMADLVCGAAMEGKPNFAITATIGMVLLMDAGVSATTTVLREAGVIDWSWEGIPGYIGRGAGMGVAGGLNALDGGARDRRQWGDWGSMAGTAASIFLGGTHAAGSIAGTGIRVSHDGVRLLHGVSLAGKKLRISRHGVDLVRGGRHWLDSARVYHQSEGLRSILSGVRVGMDAFRLASRDVPRSTGATAPSIADILRNGSAESLSRYLRENPRHPLQSDLMRALNAARGRWLTDLLDEGYIEAHAQGVDMQTSVLRVRRRVPHDVTVIVPAGTFLTSHDLSVQNMIVTRKAQRTLSRDGWIDMPISVTCANRHRAAPTTATRFDIQAGPGAQALRRLAQAIEREGMGADARQLAVWIVTDDLSLEGTRLHQSTDRQSRVETANLLGRILVLCYESGVDVPSLAIWRDRAVIRAAMNHSGTRMAFDRIR